jgi:hypothetical protein
MASSIPPYQPNKILVTGTGRCGTTFLMLVLSFAGADTGFTLQNFKHDITDKCNSGLERKIDCRHTILKNPRFLTEIEEIVTQKPHGARIRKVIIPIRDYEKSAESRATYGAEHGGLWNATDYQSQLDFFYTAMAQYNRWMVQYDIPTIFLDFDRMVTDPQYLFGKLSLDVVTCDYPTFLNAFQIATLHQNRTLKEQVLSKPGQLYSFFKK